MDRVDYKKGFFFSCYLFYFSKSFYIIVSCTEWVDIPTFRKNAYLYGKLSNPVYLEQPKGFIVKNRESCVLKLKRALYGLHQSGKEWYNELDRTFIELGFQKLLNCNCVYMLNSSAIIFVYLDDLALFVKNNEILNKVCNLIGSKFEFKDLGNLTCFLGV